MFEIGQKVVCVDEARADDSARDGRRQIRKGAVYTIRWVGNYHHDYKGDYLGVRLIGINRSGPEAKDTPYHARRFRPLHKTDISVFTAMLQPKSAKQREPV